jgi:hypothetical protein
VPSADRSASVARPENELGLSDSPFMCDDPRCSKI